jgi:P-type Cu+ transporter
MQVDPLRARAVLLFDDGFRFLCGADCRRRYLEGQRYQHTAAVKTAESKQGRREHVAQSKHPEIFEEDSVTEPKSKQNRVLWLGIGAVFCSMISGVFSDVPALSLISAFFACLAAGAALCASWPAVSSIGWLAWALGPAGAVGAAVGAAYANFNGGHAWLSLEGAALASAAMLARAWFDFEARIPIAAEVRELQRGLPTNLHVPVKDAADPMAVSMEVIPTENVRTGEDVFALEGETVGVDGVVQAGEASALLYPGALAPVRRVVGDPLLAGSTIVKGAVRILASRVGENRALVRVKKFGLGEGHDAAPIARTADLVTRWGGLATIGLAVSVFVLANSGGGLATSISAASAVLLAAPLLALRRAASSPLVVAATSAVRRGIVFQSANALDKAGRIAVVAMSPHGILTEGKPVVLEMHAVESRSVESCVALAAAAEEAAASHPIANAIREFARANRIAPQQVRRAVFHPGRGVTALASGGEELAVGNRKLLLDHGVSVAAADAIAFSVESSGHTAIFVSLAGRVRGVFSLQDPLRPGARAAIQRLMDMNLEVVLLTGDQRGTVERIGAGLDIAHIKAELLPSERGHEVKLLRDAGGHVAVIGNPQDDHEALSEADVGIALGAAGGTTSERAVALVTKDVRDAAAMLWIARAAREDALRSTTLAACAFATIIAAAAAGLIVPGIAALLAVAVDGYAVRAGVRLLRRIELRLPART